MSLGDFGVELGEPVDSSYVSYTWCEEHRAVGIDTSDRGVSMDERQLSSLRRDSIWFYSPKATF